MQEKWGKLSDIGFPRLLHNIFTARDTASALDIEDRNIKKRFFFKTGVPVYSISNVLNEVLGRLMVRKGVITQEIYEKSLEIMLNGKKKQGDVLLSSGHITPHQLNDALNIQAKERLFSAFNWLNGTYHYQTIEKLPKDLFLSPIHPAYAILHALKGGYYPADRMKEAIDDNKEQLVAFSNKTVYALEDFQPTPAETRVLTLIDGNKKLGELLVETETKFSISKEDIYPFIYALLATDILILKQFEKEKKPNSPSPEDRALIEELTGKYIHMKSLNSFEILGVSQDADIDTIKKAYFKLAKQYHPDKYHNNIHDVLTAASDIFTLINTAYNTLSDKNARRTYEESLKKNGEKQDIHQDAANIMNAELQFQKGKIALSRKDYKSAKEALEWTVKLNPNEGEYKAYLGWTIFNLSPKDAAEVKKAKELIQDGIASNPKQDRAYYFLGVIHRVEGNLEEAEAAFNKAVHKNPHLSEAQSELRLIQTRKQKEDKGFFKNIFK